MILFTVSGMFGCGDDKGNIWVYKLKRSDRNHVERADKNPVVRELEQGCDPESHPKRRRRDGSMKRTSVDRPQMRKPIGMKFNLMGHNCCRSTRVGKNHSIVLSVTRPYSLASTERQEPGQYQTSARGQEHYHR